MSTKLRDKIKTFSKERQEKIARLAAELVEEEMTLQEMRKQQNLTQEQVAQLLGIGQENVSRLERRNNLYVSTLRDYVNAVGGKLHLIVEFPDREPIKLLDHNDSTTTTKDKSD